VKGEHLHLPLPCVMASIRDTGTAQRRQGRRGAEARRGTRRQERPRAARERLGTPTDDAQSYRMQMCPHSSATAAPGARAPRKQHAQARASATYTVWPRVPSFENYEHQPTLAGWGQDANPVNERSSCILGCLVWLKFHVHLSHIRLNRSPLLVEEMRL
jgi:hypothetical protein